MLALSLLLLTAAPAPLRLAVPDFSVINVPKESAAFFMDRFANKLRAKGLAVTTATEIDAVLGLERQKALLGCSEDSSSCQMEILAALGADGIIRARIARFGQRFELSLTLIDAASVGVLASFSDNAADETKVLESLDAAADQLSAKFIAAKRGKVGVVAGVEEPAPRTGRPVWVPLIPLAVGIGAGVYGAVQLGASFDKVKEIETTTTRDPSVVASEARTARALGISLLGVGAAGIATAAILFFTGREPVATPVASLSANGAWVGIEGRLP